MIKKSIKIIEFFLLTKRSNNLKIKKIIIRQN